MRSSVIFLITFKSVKAILYCYEVSDINSWRRVVEVFQNRIYIFSKKEHCGIVRKKVGLLSVEIRFYKGEMKRFAGCFPLSPTSRLVEAKISRPITCRVNKRLEWKQNSLGLLPSYRTTNKRSAIRSQFHTVLVSFPARFSYAYESYAIWSIPSGIPGKLFCRVMQTNLVLKLLWKYSISIVMTMTIERWYTITQPVRYKGVYKSRNVLLQLISLLAFSIIILIPELFTIRLGRRDSRKVCIVNTFGEQHNNFQGLRHFHK